MSGVIKARVDGLTEAKATFATWMKQVEKTAMRAAAGLASEALKEMLVKGPQYTGDFVSSWTVSFDTPAQFFRPWPQGAAVRAGLRADNSNVEPYAQGDIPAIEYALARATPRFAAAALRPLGTTIYLSNNAVHDEYYAWKIENNQINFRPQNKVMGDPHHLREQGIGYVLNRYRQLDRAKLQSLFSRMGV